MIEDPEYIVEENIGVLKVPLRRKGDLKPLVKVVCITTPGAWLMSNLAFPCSIVVFAL